MGSVSANPNRVQGKTLYAIMKINLTRFTPYFAYQKDLIFILTSID
ncbi:hypothetical protein XBO1_2420010 [Xenorhabdus bovienii str. oregonense]|uniref:Uncharacterized protein n=2 Tax=Xenorhabdus bovienii TaxID=40576 RepID=A0A0B6X4T6_XENBV|nr:hypothetical protein XBO1_2420010 [Xenorhabdus bovienii str. oregonense]CDM88595.1 protein of unknown function [Xenorhabdus bovienii]